MNPGLIHLKQYPFARLHAALADITPPPGIGAIDLSIGEPRQSPPKFIIDTLKENLDTIGNYPATSGLDSLRQAQASWMERRSKLAAGSIDPNSQVLPVNGSREALFAFAQCVLNKKALVCMANPYYQIYEGAAILAGAKCHFIRCLEQNQFAPDYDQVSPAIWKKCQLLYLCSPDNPTGHCVDSNSFAMLLELAERYDFVIAADECYIDIYPDEDNPPPGVLQLCQQLGIPGQKSSQLQQPVKKIWSSRTAIWIVAEITH